MDNLGLSAWIGVGANLHNPDIQVKRAIQGLDTMPDTSVKKVSSFYQTTPISPILQPDFINAVVRIKTTLEPHDLLTEMLNLEHSLGRVRSEVRNEPRIIDLDLLIYDQVVISSEELTLPHPRIIDRLFVMKPLMELEGNITIPKYGSISTFAARCRDQKVFKLEDGE
ncbi:MAG: 2-amino-4-hydroxy-6-hydroxymethyldihydropteridine diphosphokinase [Acidiferrobacteraceae bacterium]|nr:2-amino-4-hydroxy-6-hydroxymethyldihydropteridine diphosphokinase [Acidiferrobacteraceae bacterium]|tara:strand:- start:1080 stop:1583 length:504 start_codon:yes stop_codon:yes gene_type:complete